MKTNSLKLLALATGVSMIAQSCSGPTYVQSSPPPPVYAQAPPPPPPAYTPPPQDTYYDRDQPTASAPAQEEAPVVTYQSFYNELSPYGQWVNTPEYGNVWVPSAGAQFQPYGSCGHWVLTDYGWTWVSDYNWGWAPFHYGRWEFDGLMGWYWIPGYEWSPAWVNWRTCNGYYGWAPLGPTYVNGGYASYSCPPERYVFVNATYINSPNVYNYYEPRNQNTTYYSRSTVVTNTYYDRGSNQTYYSGPQSTEVARYTGAPVQPVHVVSSNSPERTGVSGSEVKMFRPTVQQPGIGQNARPVPPKVYQKSDIAPIAQRPVLTQPNQPRVTPFKPENIQHPATSQNQQQPQQQQRPPVQEQHPEVQQQQSTVQQQPAQQQRPPMQQQPPVQQQPAQQQRPPMQQQPPVQQQPAQQQRPPMQQQPPVQQQPAQQQRPPIQQQPAQPQQRQQQRPPKQQQPKPQKQQKPAKQQNQVVPNQKDGGRQ